jgi:hypothetical protein
VHHIKFMQGVGIAFPRLLNLPRATLYPDARKRLKRHRQAQLSLAKSMRTMLKALRARVDCNEFLA